MLVFPRVAEDHPGPFLPFQDAADIRRLAECWWDADHGVARLVCLGMAGAIPEVLPDPQAVGAEKSAVREPVPADVVLDHLAWVLNLERPASAVLVE